MADTNWVVDNFDVIQEEGGNILFEEGQLMALQEYNDTVWTKDTSTGAG